LNFQDQFSWKQKDLFYRFIDLSSLCRIIIPLPLVTENARDTQRKNTFGMRLKWWNKIFILQENLFFEKKK